MLAPAPRPRRGAAWHAAPPPRSARARKGRTTQSDASVSKARAACRFVRSDEHRRRPVAGLEHFQGLHDVEAGEPGRSTSRNTASGRDARIPSSASRPPADCPVTRTPGIRSRASTSAARVCGSDVGDPGGQTRGSNRRYEAERRTAPQRNLARDAWETTLRSTCAANLRPNAVPRIGRIRHRSGAAAVHGPAGHTRSPDSPSRMKPGSRRRARRASLREPARRRAREAPDFVDQVGLVGEAAVDGHARPVRARRQRASRRRTDWNRTTRQSDLGPIPRAEPKRRSIWRAEIPSERPNAETLTRPRRRRISSAAASTGSSRRPAARRDSRNDLGDPDPLGIVGGREEALLETAALAAPDLFEGGDPSGQDVQPRAEERVGAAGNEPQPHRLDRARGLDEEGPGELSGDHARRAAASAAADRPTPETGCRGEGRPRSRRSEGAVRPVAASPASDSFCSRNQKHST